MVTAVDLLRLGTATLGESGAVPMHSRLRAAWPGARVAGPAYPVSCAVADNLAIHVAVAEAPAGSVLVVDADEVPDRGYWGEVLTTGAEARGIAGLVIDGGVRDVAALTAHGFPVFASMVALRGAGKVAGGQVGHPVTVGDVVVRPGDWVVADADGVVVIPGDTLDAVVEAGTDRVQKEMEIFAALRGGATTIELLGLDPTVVDRA